MADWREGKGKPRSKGKPAQTPQPTPKAPKDPSDWRARRKNESAAAADRSDKTYLQENKPKGPKHIGLLNLLLIALVLLVGAFIIIIARQPTTTPMMHLATLEHDDSLWAPNAFALEDLNNFTLSMEDAASNLELVAGQGMAAAAAQRKPWSDLNEAEFTSAVTKYLDTANGPGGPRPGGWIFYFSCHGVTNFDGIPYLVAKNSQALSPDKPVADGKLVPLESILRAISDHPKVKQYPKSYKLLVFDMGRMESQWSANRLYNDFPSAAQLLAKSLPQDVQLFNTHLLLSSSDGQKSWANPAEGGTNFGLFFGRGLMGEANKMPTSLQDEQVSLAELETYLQKNVDQWAIEQRDSRQVPILISIGDAPDHSEIQLIHVSDAQFQVSPTSVTPSSSSDQQRLGELWNALKLLGDHGALKLAPYRFSLIQYDLVRAEQLAESGVAYQTELTQSMKGISEAIADLASTVAKYDTGVKSAILDSQLPYYKGSRLQRDLASAEPFPLNSLACWRSTNPGPITKIPTLDQLKAHSDLIKEQSKDKDLPTEKRAKPLVCADYYKAAESLLDHFTKQNQRDMTPASIELILEYLRTAPNSPVKAANEGTHVVEVELLAMMRDFFYVLQTNFGIEASSQDAIPYRNAMVDALQCRRRLEKIAFVEDERVFPWLEQQLDTIDQQRRQAEDLLFALQPEQASQQIRPLLEDPKGLEALEEKKTRLIDAYVAVDSVRASAPSLLSWLTHHPYPDDERRFRLGQVTTAIEKTHELANAITPRKLEGERRPDYTKLAAPDQALIDQITQNYGDVVSFLNRESQDIIDAQGGKDHSDSETLLEIYNLLRVGYVAKLNRSMTTYDRVSLQKTKQDMLQETLGNANVQPDSMSPLIVGLASYQKGPWPLALNKAGGTSDYRITAPSSEEDPDASTLLKDSADVVLFAESTVANSLRKYAAPEENATGFPSVANAAEATAFTGLVVKKRVDIQDNLNTPTQYEFRRQRKEHLAWCANRTMQDFWGSEETPHNPYFDRLATSFLNLFNDESEATVDAPSELAGKVNDRLGQLRTAHANWVTADNLVIEKSDDSGNINHKLEIGMPAALPKGICAIDLLVNATTAIPVSDYRGKEDRSHTFETRLASASETPRVFEQIIKAKQLDDSTSNKEQFRYRGNVKRFDLDIPYAKKPNSIVQEIEFSPFPFAQPTVSVAGELSGTADVIFILDCSGSMAKPAPQNQKDRNEGRRVQTRMTVAKDVMQGILQNMASPKGRFRVLLYAFGNRVGWKNNQVSKRPGINVPDNIVPANDVEALVKDELTPLLNRDPRRNEDGVNVTRLRNAVSNLAARGETPLYYSIYEALQQVDKSKPTQIIVITDGANDQADVPSAKPYRIGALELGAELRKQEYQNTQLQIVGFALGEQARNLEQNPNPRPKENTLDEIAWVAKSDGRGGFIAANERVELARRIEDLVKTKIYYSVQRDDDPTSPTPYEFEEIWHAPLSDFLGGARQNYTVRELQTNDTAKIQLRGGEKVRFLYDSDLRQLYFKDDPADEAEQASISVNDALKYDGEYLARILNFRAPDPETRTLEIPVRLENSNNRYFTVRPFHVWTEIIPSATNAFRPSDVSETRYFSDLLLRNGTQFPEFLIRLNRWPAAAKWARMKVYTQLEKPIEPIKSIPLSNLLVNNATITVENLDAGNFQVESSTSLDQYKYHIVVRVEPGARGIEPHHVGITPAPKQIQRTYTLAGDGSKKILNITHRFMYESKTDVDMGPGSQIQIWTREQLTTGAPHFTVDVQIPKW